MVPSWDPARGPRRPDRGATRLPATRDQADAYRFGLRRLEAALVRGDPVPLHEQIRSQRRAALGGVVIALLAVCAVGVYALIVPSPDWRTQAVIVGSPSGAMYVVAHHSDRLVPVANLPAARLVLAALRQGGSASADPAGAKPVEVPDAALDDAPRTPTAAVPGALAVRLDGQVVAPRWAVCDQVDGEGRVVATTVIGAMATPAPTPVGDGVLLAAPDDSTWLVTGGRRHRVDMGDGRLRAAFQLGRGAPRAATAGMVSALPEGPRLGTPQITGRGGPAPAGLPGRVGDVVVARPVAAPESAPQYFVVLPGGLQEVRGVLVDLLVVAAGRPPLPLGGDVLASAELVEDLPVDGWPSGPPRMWEPAEAPVVCWTWTADGDPSGGAWWGPALPLPAGMTPVLLAQADGPGERVDAVAVGAGGAVRATGPGRAPGSGPMWLLSATGVGYGVTDDATAVALGITAAEPAPEAALRLLPSGPTLDLAEAGRVVDGPPVG